MLAVGLDVVGIARIRAVLGRRGERFLQRVLTPDEQAYCRSHRDPAPSVAARWAAKEAVMKALGTGHAQGVDFLHIEVVRDAAGAPQARLYDAAQRRFAALGGRSLLLSITHADGIAAAVAVIGG